MPPRGCAITTAWEWPNGDEILIIGPTTGAVPLTVQEIRVDLKPVESTVKGESFSIKTDVKIRPSDRLYVWKPTGLKH